MGKIINILDKKIYLRDKIDFVAKKIMLDRNKSENMEMAYKNILEASLLSNYSEIHYGYEIELCEEFFDGIKNSLIDIINILNDIEDLSRIEESYLIRIELCFLYILAEENKGKENNGH